jgi:hypothetical protein
VIRLKLLEFANNEIERFIPTGAFKTTVPFDERIQQTIWMMNLQVCGYAFGTEPALINRKVVARFNSDHMIILDQ